MKYVNQLDYPHWLYITRTQLEDEKLRESGKTTTIKSSGCGLCSAVIVAHRLIPNCGFELRDALELSYEVEANHRIGTDYNRFAPAFAEKLGLKLVESRDIEDLRHCLRTGGAAVYLVRGDRDGQVGLFTHTSHYITVINEEADGRFAILDPALTETKYKEEGRDGKVEVTKHGIILSEAKYVVEEADVKSIPFYLFWRQ